MKRTLLFGSIMSAALAVGVGAQTTPPQTQPPTSGTSSQQRQSGDQSAQQVTMTGCLQQDSGSASTAGGAGATAGTAGTSGSRGSYVLANASAGVGRTGSTTGATGATTGAAGNPAGTSGSMSRVKLEGGDQSDLKQYVNSQVEIRGRMEHGSGGATSGGAGSTAGRSGSTASSGAGSTSSAAGATSPGGASMPTLHVSSVRQIAPSCNGK